MADMFRRTNYIPLAGVRRCSYCGQSASPRSAAIWHVWGCPNDTGYIPASLKAQHLFRIAP